MARQALVPFTLPADPTAALEAATKQYVDARVGVGGGAVGPTSVTFVADATANVTLTAMAAAEDYFNTSVRHVSRVDLSLYTQCRLVARRMSTASAAGALITLKYSTTDPANTFSAAAWTTSGATFSINTTNVTLDTGWITMPAGMRVNDIYIAVTQQGGDGSAAPVLGSVRAYFKGATTGAVTNLADLGDVTTSAVADGHVLTWDTGTSQWVNEAVPGGGASPASETVAGIAELATQAEATAGVDDARIVTPLKMQTWTNAAISDVFAAAQPLDADLTAIAALAPANDTLIQRKAGAWVASTPATVKTDLAITAADAGAVPTTRLITATSPVTIDGGASADLSANRTIAVSAATLTASGVVELATAAEATAQTDNVRAVTPLGLADRVLTSRTLTGTAPVRIDGGASGDLSASRTISLANDGVTNTLLATMATMTIKGNNTGSTSGPLDLTVAQVRSMISSGAGMAFGFDFDTTTTAGSAVTRLRLNNATPASATIVYVSYTTKDGVDIRTRLLAGTAGDRLFIQDRDNSANYRVYELTGAPTDNTTYATVNVVHRAGGGSLWANSEEILAGFTAPPMTVGTTAPSAPLVNDIWINTT